MLAVAVKLLVRFMVFSKEVSGASRLEGPANSAWMWRQRGRWWGRVAQRYSGGCQETVLASIRAAG